ncbi:hypothetical protein OAS39_00210 [Pirellulales bacterium]|nr:hypothetical protein [Pirellulales bacterium]
MIRPLPLIACAALLMPSLACREKAQPAPSEAPSGATATVKLTVIVVDDAALASGIRLQQGEWNAQSGGNLQVVEVDRALLSSRDLPQGDLVTFPPRYLGGLVHRELLRTMRATALDNDRFNPADVFPLVRQHEITYGGEAYALPLYSTTPLLCIAGGMESGSNSDDDAVPVGVVRHLSTNWSAYLAAGLALREAGGERIAEPTDEPWLAAMLILRAGCYSETDDRADLLFDRESMIPRLLAPTFVRSLSEMEQLHRSGAQDNANWRGDAISPGGASARVLTATASAAVGLPPASSEIADSSNAPAGDSVRRETSWHETPPAEQAYSATLQEWRDFRGDPPAMLGTGGALLAVTSSTRNTASAFRLASWLAESERAQQIARGSAAAMPCRASQAAASGAWFGDVLTADEKGQAAAAVQSLLSRDAFVQIPRIPAIDEYLAALHQAAARAISGDVPVEDALIEASKAWEQITDRFGREKQREAYQRHLGPK